MFVIILLCTVAYSSYQWGWNSALNEAEKRIKEEMLYQAYRKD